jgi:hypothetical protein
VQSTPAGVAHRGARVARKEVPRRDLPGARDPRAVERDRPLCGTDFGLPNFRLGPSGAGDPRFTGYDCS